MSVASCAALCRGRTGIVIAAGIAMSSQQVLSSESFTQNCILSILFSFAVFYTACTNAVHVLSMYTAGI